MLLAATVAAGGLVAAPASADDEVSRFLGRLLVPKGERRAVRFHLGHHEDRDDDRDEGEDHDDDDDDDDSDDGDDGGDDD
jgi:hypothetical protein